jgi:uncharacterized protein with GYD domain
MGRCAIGSIAFALSIEPMPQASADKRIACSFRAAPACLQRRTIMATYISLSSFTDQGARTVKETVERADAVKEGARKFGCTMLNIFWTQGEYDLVSIIEAPDDASAMAFGLAISQAGNVRLQTMRAFSRDEMAGILGKLR